MEQQRIAFIGGGNMTRAIVGGLLDDGFAALNLSIAEPMDEQRAVLGRELPGVYLSPDNDDVAARADTVVLAVKPQIIAAVCKRLAAAVGKSRPLIVSIAAGPRIADIDAWLGGGNAIVRVMPNQPALLGHGVSGLFANAATSPAQLEAARQVMGAVGPVVTVPAERDIDAVTAVSGSGPAYFYLLIDMLAKTGESLGLDAASANLLARETAAGASALARASDESMEDLIGRVRSPGGTTAAALDSLLQDGIRDIVARALTAARDRATQLADQAHEQSQE